MTAYEMSISVWSSDVCSSDLDDHHAAAVDAAQAADDGGVVGIGAVAGQFLELVADHPDVLVGVRPRGVARQLRDLPRGEVAKDLRGAQATLVLQRVQLGVDVDRRTGDGDRKSVVWGKSVSVSGELGG